MLRKLSSYPIVHYSVTAAVVLGLLICVFPHYIPSLSWGVNYAVHLMLFYLFAGIAMLFFRQPRLTFIFFGGCAFLCIFLKFSLKSSGLPRFRPTPPKNQRASTPAQVKVAHLNLTNAASLAQVAALLRATEADLVSIHELTPDWTQPLEDSLGGLLPYHHHMVDIGIFGMAIYAKHPIEDIDTFYYQEIPNLKGCIKKEGETFCFVSVHTEPALNEYSLRRLQQHLEVVGEQVRATEAPMVVMGDFNAVSWSDEIQFFLDRSALMASRTGFLPYPLFNTSSIFKVPLDHIFYSKNLECNGFENLTAGHPGYLGIIGTYSQNNLVYHAEKEAQ